MPAHHSISHLQVRPLSGLSSAREPALSATDQSSESATNQVNIEQPLPDYSFLRPHIRIPQIQQVSDLNFVRSKALIVEVHFYSYYVIQLSSDLCALWERFLIGF